MADSKAPLKTEWKTLIEAWPHRFLMGVDLSSPSRLLQREAVVASAQQVHAPVDGGADAVARENAWALLSGELP